MYRLFREILLVVLMNPIGALQTTSLPTDAKPMLKSPAPAGSGYQALRGLSGVAAGVKVGQWSAQVA